MSERLRTSLSPSRSSSFSILAQASNVGAQGNGSLKPKGAQALFTRGNDVCESLAFAVAIQEFKELCRRDLCSSEKVGQ